MVESFTSTNPESDDSPTVKPSNKPRRKNLTTAERLRIINDFKHGVPDKYYSVNPNPRRPGEFIVRKRKTPIEYDIEQCESPNHKRNNSIPSIASDEGLTDQALSKTPSQLLTESKPALNPLAGTEFFSMQSSLNANLQRELDALHEKFNKLDAKFRKERAARKDPKQRSRKPKPQPESRALSPESEYEYAYVDAPPVARTLSSPASAGHSCGRTSFVQESSEVPEQPRSIGYNPSNYCSVGQSPFGLARRPNIDIRDF